MDEQHDDRLNFHRQWIQHCEQEFQETKNALYAWSAIHECLLYGDEIPPHARAYLQGVAARINQLTQFDRIPSKGKIDRAIADAVGIKARGGANPFRALTRPGHEIWIAFQVYNFQGKHRHYSWTAIFKSVMVSHRRECTTCRRPISWQTVRKCWYAHARTVIPPHLQERSQKLDDILK